MLVSLLYKVVRKLLSVPSMVLRREAAKDAELPVLRHENAVLGRQLVGQVHYEPADRFWFTALSALIPRRRRREVFPVAPGTLLRRHRHILARTNQLKSAKHEGPTRPGKGHASGSRPPTSTKFN